MQYWQRRLQRSVTESRRFRSGREKVSWITPLFYRLRTADCGLERLTPRSSLAVAPSVLSPQSGSPAASVLPESAGFERLRPHSVGEDPRDLPMDELRIAALGTLLDAVAPAPGAGLDPAPERHFASARKQCEVFQVRHTGLPSPLQLLTITALSRRFQSQVCLFDELRFLRRTGHRRRTRLASRDDLAHEIEVPGADLSLMLRRGIALGLGRELRLLKLGVRQHAALPVVARQLEHPEVQRVESGERNELKLVTHRGE